MKNLILLHDFYNVYYITPFEHTIDLIPVKFQLYYNNTTGIVVLK
jgi:hypothetical protein